MASNELVTREELINAQIDVTNLAYWVNLPYDYPDPNGTGGAGFVTLRLGRVVRNLAKVIHDIGGTGGIDPSVLEDLWNAINTNKSDIATINETLANIDTDIDSRVATAIADHNADLNAHVDATMAQRGWTIYANTADHTSLDKSVVPGALGLLKEDILGSVYSDWNDYTDYEYGAIVQHNGITYVAIAASGPSSVGPQEPTTGPIAITPVGPGGTQWSNIQMPYTDNWVKVAYGNGVYVIISENSGSGYNGAYSPYEDASEWEPVVMPIRMADITFGNGRFFAIQYMTTSMGQNIIYTSFDGVEWTRVGQLPNTSSTNYSKIMVANNGNIVVFGSFSVSGGVQFRAKYSTDDGVTWVDSTVPTSADGNRTGLVKTDTGRIVSLPLYANESLLSSTDGGVTFTALSMLDPSASAQNPFQFGLASMNGVLVAFATGEWTGTSSQAYKSTNDGVSWSRMDFGVVGGFTPNSNTAATGGIEFVVSAIHMRTGTSSPFPYETWVSEDATTWTNAGDLLSYASSVFYGGGVFFALPNAVTTGSTNYIRISTQEVEYTYSQYWKQYSANDLNSLYKDLQEHINDPDAHEIAINHQIDSRPWRDKILGGYPISSPSTPINTMYGINGVFTKDFVGSIGAGLPTSGRFVLTNTTSGNKTITWQTIKDDNLIVWSRYSTSSMAASVTSGDASFTITAQVGAVTVSDVLTMTVTNDRRVSFSTQKGTDFYVKAVNENGVSVFDCIYFNPTSSAFRNASYSITIQGGSSTPVIANMDSSGGSFTVTDSSTTTTNASLILQGGGATGSSTIPARLFFSATWLAVSTPPTWTSWTMENSIMSLSANTTFYVRADGNDANDGLTSGTAKATIAGAVNTIRSYFTTGRAITVDIGPGTFNDLNIVTGGLGDAQSVTFRGAGIGETIVQSSTSNTNAISINNYPAWIFVQNMTVSAPSGATCFSAVNTRRTTIQNVEFVGAGQTMISAQLSAVYLANTINLNGTFNNVLYFYNNSTLLSSAAIDFNAATNWTGTFLSCYDNSMASIVGTSFANTDNIDTGTGLNRRFIVDRLSHIYTNGAGVNFIPGGTDGVIGTSGGFYI